MRKRPGGRIPALTHASARIRAHLDTAHVLSALVEEVRGALKPATVSVWLDAAGDPTLVAGHEEADPAVRDLVRRCAKRDRTLVVACPVGPRVELAVPVGARGPGSRLVLYARMERGLDPAAREFVEALADETAFVLHAAGLYERAVAAKEKSEAILERVADGVVVTDHLGRILEANRASESIFGGPGQAMVGRRCEEMLGLSCGERVLDCRDGCALLTMLRGGSSEGQEVWRPRADGGRQPIFANVAAVSDRDLRVSQVVHSFRDITKLREADEAKTLFLATASHELKTPLTVIQGFAQTLLLNKAMDASSRDRALRAIERRAQQLNRIVDRLLLSSRIDAGRVDVSVRDVDVLPILRERAGAMADATEHHVRVFAPTEVPVARADGDALATVIDHLIDNAVKFSPHDRDVDLEITSDESVVRIVVRDYGVGMDADQTRRCFERFWQAESSESRRYGGTGIGLYIVRSLVEAMGGSVTVASVPGEGSAFTVRLARPGLDAPLAEEPAGEPSVIREFMRQIGIPGRRTA